MITDEHIKKAESFYGKKEIEANLHLRQAAKQGSADALFELALRYAMGIPVLDLDEARTCLQKATLLGSIKAEYALECCRRSLVLEAGEPDDLLAAIEKSQNLNDYDLESHWKLMGVQILNTGQYDKYYIQVQKTLAELGSSDAAGELTTAYGENWFDYDEIDTGEEIRWTLIESFLSGDRNWSESANECTLVEGCELGSIVEEVRGWIGNHPIAQKAALSAWHKKRFIEPDGPVG